MIINEGYPNLDHLKKYIDDDFAFSSNQCYLLSKEPNADFEELKYMCNWEMPLTHCI